MGCDIHAYVEYKYKDSNYWRSFGGRINPGRIYGMFAKLADVRNDFGIKPISEPRGIPDDIGSDAFDDYADYISEEDNKTYVTKEQAQKWVISGSSKYLREGKFVSGPDWHSGSFCSADELEKCINEIWANRCNGNEVEYKAILNVMRTFENAGWDARLVFWFDN